jgi:exopolyphosphatase/guanosine-5'-triphosphate,3'-diphosphate pyrophosphatase
MSAAMAELRVERINPVGGALRLGVLHDLLGRTVDRDARVVTIERFAERYHVDREHAQRVSALAKALYLRGAARPTPEAAQRVVWAALLHEIGFTVSHIGFHKHGAYILQHADMPGFSSGEQSRLALLVLGCRGNLVKIAPALADADARAQVVAVRLAVILHHARRPIRLPAITLAVRDNIRFTLPARWLAAHPLTAHLLDKERAEWEAAGHPMRRAS